MCWKAPTEDNPDGFFQRNLHTLDHPDTIAFASELRAVVDEFSRPPRFVFGDAEVLRRYCGEQADGLNLVFLFKTLRMRLRRSSAKALIEEFERAFPDPFTPTYVFGNHDRPRSIHRLGGDPEKAKLMATLQLTVRGVPFLYYGEEIGMHQQPIALARGLDPVAARFRAVPGWLVGMLRRSGILLNRDECRTPMQWDAGPNAGFSRGDAAPWLPVHPNASELNVSAQHDDPGSLFSCYRGLLALRRGQRALHAGSLELLDDAGLPDEVLGYRRTYEESTEREVAEVFLNFSGREATLDLRRGEHQSMFSSRRGLMDAAPRSYTLAPYEGLVLLGGTDRLPR